MYEGMRCSITTTKHCVTQETPSCQQLNELCVGLLMVIGARHQVLTSGNTAQTASVFVHTLMGLASQVSCITAKRQLNNTSVSSAESRVSAHPSVCVKQLIRGLSLAEPQPRTPALQSHTGSRGSHLNTNQTGPTAARRGRNDRARGDCRLWLGNEKQLISEDARNAADS